MVFYCGLNLGDGITRNVVIFGKVKNDDQVLRFKQKEMLGNSLVLETLREGTNASCLVDIANDHPIVVCENGGLNLVSIYNQLSPLLNTTIEESTYANLSKAISSQGFDFDVEDARTFVDGCRELQKYMAEPANIRVDIEPRFLKDVSLLSKLREINQGNQGLSFVASGINKTLFMKTPNDKAFVKLPSIANIMDESYALPTKGEVMPDYPNPDYSTPNYKNFAPVGDLPDIEGSSSNNRLGIQDNEIEYFNALKEFYIYGLKQEYDKDIEELTVDEIKQSYVYMYLMDLSMTFCYFNWDHTGLVPRNFEVDVEDSEEKEEVTYFTKLKTEGTSIFISAETKLKGYLEACLVNNKLAPIETVVKLLRWGSRKPSKLLLSDCKVELDLNSFSIQATKESFDDGEVNIVNGVEFKLLSVIDATGTFKDKTYLRNIGIHNFQLNAPVGILCVREYLINNKTKSINQYVYMSLFDVIELLKERPNAIDGIHYSNGGFKIKYTYGDDTMEQFRTPLNHAIGRVNADKENEHNLYVSSTVITHGLALNAKTAKLGYLNVLDKYLYSDVTALDITNLSYTSKEECAEKIAYGKPVEELVQANIASTVLIPAMHMFERAQESLEEHGEVTLEEALRLTEIALLENPIDLSLEDDDVISKPQSNVSGATNKLARLNISGGEDKQEVVKSQEETVNVKQETVNVKREVEVQPQQPVGNTTQSVDVLDPKVISKSLAKYMLKEITDDMTLHPVTLSQQEKRVVAYVAIVQTGAGKQYIFCDVNETKGRKTYDIANGEIVTTGVSTLPLGSLIPSLLKGLGRAMLGVIDKNVVFYSDIPTLNKLIDTISKANIRL